MLCRPDWPETLFVTEGDLELLIFLPSPPKCWDYGSVSPYLDLYIRFVSRQGMAVAGLELVL